jgi:hypothetical protein
LTDRQRRDAVNQIRSKQERANMSTWTASAEKHAPKDRSILVIAKARINDGTFKDRRYRLLAKWDDEQKAFYPEVNEGVSSPPWSAPQLEVIYWAEVPELPHGVSVEN